MDALDLLLNRVSVTRLCEPAPDAAQLDLLFRAALRAPDHAQLRPWRFLTVEGDARQRLGEVFAAALQARDPQAPQEALDKARNMPLRAPMLILVIASPKAHPKVPQSEQLLATACAAHGLLLAAHAQGLGAVWRTGDFAYDRQVLGALGLDEHEQMLGFIYLGTPEGRLRSAPQPDPQAFVSRWDAQ